MILFTSDLLLNQLRIMAKFNMMSLFAAQGNPGVFAQFRGEEVADLWHDAAIIRKMAHEIQSLLGTVPEEEVDVQDR